MYVVQLTEHMTVAVPLEPNGNILFEEPRPWQIIPCFSVQQGNLVQEIAPIEIRVHREAQEMRKLEWELLVQNRSHMLFLSISLQSFFHSLYSLLTSLVVFLLLTIWFWILCQQLLTSLFNLTRLIQFISHIRQKVKKPPQHLLTILVYFCP